MSYGYNASGQLTRVTLPATAAYPAGSDITYLYDSFSRLISVTEAGQTSPFIVNTYDTYGRVIVQQLGDATQVSTIDYSAFPKIRVTSREHHVVDYYIDSATNRIGKVVVVSADDPLVTYTTTYSYDANGALVSILFPSGRVIVRTYDSGNESPRARHNLLAINDLGPSGMWTEERWTYTVDFNNVETHLTPRAVAMGGIQNSALATVYTYDSKGNVASVRLPLTPSSGPSTTMIQYQHDSHGRTTQKSDPLGVVTTYEYSSGILEALARTVIENQGPDQVVTNYSYDAAGNMTQRVSDCACGSGSSDISYTYDERNQLSSTTESVTQSLFSERQYVRDPMGFVVDERVRDDSATGDGWANTHTTYNVLHQPLTRTVDIDATTTATTSFQYDKEQQLVRIDAPDPPAWEYDYDERGLLTRIRIVATNGSALSMDYHYDADGRVISITDPKGVLRPVSWDGIGRLVAETDADGNTWKYTLNEDGLATKCEVFSPASVLLRQTFCSWDEQRRPVSMKVLALTNSGQALGQSSYLEQQLAYDAAGHLVQELRTPGPTTNYTYDARGRLVSVRDSAVPRNGADFTYYGSGRLKSAAVVEGNELTGISTPRLIADNVQYDRSGNVVSVTDGLGSSVLAEWNIRGLLAGSTDRLGRKVAYQYDELGRLLERRQFSDSSGTPSSTDVITRYVYSGVTRLQARKATDYLGAEQVTQYSYEPFGHISSALFPDGSTFQYIERDAFLQPTLVRDRSGSTIQYTRDPAGRITAVGITPADGIVGALTYAFQRDPLGRVIHATNEHSAVDRQYNTLGQLEHERVTSMQTGVVKDVFATYDGEARISTLLYPSNTTQDIDAVKYTYDVIGRLKGVARLLGTSEQSVVTTTYSGNRPLSDTGPVRSSIYTYDGAGRLSGLSHLRSGIQVANMLFGYDAVDNVTAAYRAFFGLGGQQLSGSQYDRFAAYLYDAFDRLVFAAKGMSLASYIAHDWAAAAASALYVYDCVWNRRSLTQTLAGGTPSATTYLANGLNEYTSVGQSAAISYDQAGRLVANQSEVTASYDAMGRVVGLTQSGSSSHSYYDAFGRRMETVLDASATRERFTYWMWSPVEQQTDDGTSTTKREFTYGRAIDDVLEMRDVGIGDTFALFPDERGSPIAVTDSAGNMVASYRYDEFGRRQHVAPDTGVVIAQSAINLPIGFNGRWTMAESEGLLDYRNRTYSTDWGRFLQPDPLGYAQGTMNQYHMTHGNPWRRDPLGLHDPGELSDDAEAWTHVGITKKAFQNVEAADGIGELAELMGPAVEENWNQDKTGEAAGFWQNDNFENHALGDVKARDEHALDWISKMESQCTEETLGRTLHFLQDYSAHRDPRGQPYNEVEGHALETFFHWLGFGAYDPDQSDKADAQWKELARCRVKQSVWVSEWAIRRFVDKCGDDGTSTTSNRFTHGKLQETAEILGATTSSGNPAVPGGGAGADGTGPTTGPGSPRAQRNWVGRDPGARSAGGRGRGGAPSGGAGGPSGAAASARDPAPSRAPIRTRGPTAPSDCASGVASPAPPPEIPSPAPAKPVRTGLRPDGRPWNFGSSKDKPN